MMMLRDEEVDDERSTIEEGRECLWLYPSQEDLM